LLTLTFSLTSFDCIEKRIFQIIKKGFDDINAHLSDKSPQKRGLKKYYL